MPPSPNLRVGPLSESDLPPTFQMMSQSFGRDAPFINAYFPAHDTPTGQAQGSKRLLDWKRSSPESMFLKAVSTQDDKEKIVGMAIWTHMVETPPQTLEEAEGEEEVKEYWADKREREFMKRLWTEYVKPRTKAVQNAKGKGVYVLELLAVHPEFRRLGAGAALVNLGLAGADEKNVGAVIESTDAGQKLYEKCGLSCEIEKITFDVGKEFQERKIPKLSFMVKGATSYT